MCSWSLFPELGPSSTGIPEYNETLAKRIPGLMYSAEFITPEDEVELLDHVDQELWLTELLRRVQHYGYKYDYRSRRIDESMRVGPVPEWMMVIGARLVSAGCIDEVPDQVIVNEYLPGQGITAHIDCEPCFAETIVSLTLNAGCNMDFTRRGIKECLSLYLEPRSIVVLQGAARYEWMHSIAKRRADTVLGQSVRRARRVSLTFRKVLLNG